MGARESSRQEIAKRLRNKYRERNAPGMFEAQDVGMQAYNYMKDLESCLPDGDSMFTVIADLIDPTCHAVHQGTSMDDELVCSRCGASLGAEVGGRQMFVPNFCSCCGARVVSDDD